MPALLIFGRRWPIASDDLIFSALYGIAIHSFRAVVHLWLLYPLAVHECTHPLLSAFNWLLLPTLLALVCTEYFVATVSLRGTVANEIPRLPIRKWIYIHTFFSICDFLLQLFALLIIFGHPGIACEAGGIPVLYFEIITLATILGYLIFFVVMVGLFMRSTSPQPVSQASAESQWRFWIYVLCFGHRKAVASQSQSASTSGDLLSSFAKAIADFFQDSETVPSDILVGLILVRRSQKIRQRMQERLSAQVGSNYSEERPPVRLHELADAAHYMQYALSIYGLPLYLFERFPTRIFEVLCPTRRSSAASHVSRNVQTHLGNVGWPCCCVPGHPPPLPDERGGHGGHPDLIYFSGDNGLFRSPYYICFDHKKGAVVIAIRGTLSTADCLVNLHCDLAPFSFPSDDDLEAGRPPLSQAGGLSGSAQAHAGMLQTAKNIYDEIERLNLLLPIFASARYSSYKLVCCGHSLGGGVATLLCHLLRISHFPQATCIAYAPPGCLSTREALPYFERFVTSVVLGADAVPRLSWRSVNYLQHQIGRFLRNCHYPKVHVLNSFIVTECCRSMYRRHRLARLRRALWSDDDDEDEFEGSGLYGIEDGLSQASTLEEFNRSISEEQEQSVRRLHSTLSVDDLPGQDMHHPQALRHARGEIQTFMPGRIIYFVKEMASRQNTGRESTGLSRPSNGDLERQLLDSRTGGPHEPSDSPAVVYRPVWAQQSDFQEITISVTMLTDHFPNHLQNILDQVLAMDTDDPAQPVPGLSLEFSS
ncbi:uncharacterized protein BJ171DRAFT_518816 [Polychytrium aggregatum]|uniref:uncharacterized protein n=1 Tax=Polychytrium aggregatum TaxID=110093 RepID=UPI0022FEB39C|nr:uncharacterized protein BJ171DRAFT_518816 [Polychytrium aggregatum]KAI9199330.1 hypothetical protein BJ171DRAFT_518816 [Polychytrium aggregatum]